MIGPILVFLFCAVIIAFPFRVLFSNADLVKLQHSSKIYDAQQLERRLDQIIFSYKKEKTSFEAKQISVRIWKRRQSFWLNRYLDASKQLAAVRFFKSQVDKTEERKS